MELYKVDVLESSIMYPTPELVMQVQLRPLRETVRFPEPRGEDGFRAKVELARTLAHQVQKSVAFEMYRALIGELPNEDMDWSSFDADELRKVAAENKDLRDRNDKLNAAVRAFCDFFKANGKNPDPILRTAGLKEAGNADD
jgi:tRNA splicing endonuclease